MILSRRLLKNDSVIDALSPIDIGEYIYESKLFRFRASAFPRASHRTNALSIYSAPSPQRRFPLFYVYSWVISTRYYNWKYSC